MTPPGEDDSDSDARPRRRVPLIHLLPNLMTLAAIAAGLTSIRFAMAGRYEQAVLLILLAAVFDGLDGRLARALRVDSPVGAELDSLADFLNFGVAPVLLLYIWGLQGALGIGWLAVLVYVMCAVVRLARFNVAAKAKTSKAPNAFFSGLPSPAGALLVMLPMYVSFTFVEADPVRPWIIVGHIVLIGYLMISPVPVWSFKTVRVPREHARLLLVATICIGAAVLTWPWQTLVLLCLVYVAAISWAAISKSTN